MSKNKTRHSDSSTKPFPITKLLFGVLPLSGMVWGLFAAFQPQVEQVRPIPIQKIAISVPSSSDSFPEEPPAGAFPAAHPEPAVSAEENIQLALDDPDKHALDPSKDVLRPKAPPAASLPRETLEHIAKGMELVEQSKFELAEVEFEKAAELSPNSPEVFSIWGAALRMQKKFKGANKRFARAYELAPEDEEIVFNWAMTRLHEKDAEGAIELFKKTLEINPQNHLAYNYMGKSYGLKKDYPHEEANYRKALEIKEDFAQGQFNLGIVLSLQKKFEDAAPHFTRAIELDKQYEKPFVVQFLTAMGLKKKGIGPQEAELKPTHEKDEDKLQHELEQEAKLDDQKPEGSDHKMDGSDSDVIKPVTNLRGKATINSQPVDQRGVVILETKSKLRVPKQKTQNLKIYQRELQFSPSHSVVMIGSKITFVNDDREVHNIYSKSLGNQFNLGAMAAGASREIVLETPGPVILRCNLHKDMMGTLFVVPNGYYAQTNANGEYEFKEVKSQEYILEFWHPQMYPEDTEKTVKSVKLTGKDETIDFKVASASRPGEVHDLVDATDYNKVVDNIEKKMQEAIADWKSGKKYKPAKTMLIAINSHFSGEGLKGAIAKSFSDQRSQKLEQAMDEIRKDVSGLGDPKVTAESLKFKAERIVAQLRNNVRELEQRLNPKP